MYDSPHSYLTRILALELKPARRISSGLVGEHCCSVKVMRTDIGVCDVKRDNSLGFDVDNSVLILERSFDQEKSVASNDNAVLLEYIGCEDDVGNAGFVFEGEKDEALGCAGALACDDAAGDADR
jgi:hypothetical protein